jgi:hypothetical protein
LKIVRTDRIWPEDAISRRPDKRTVLNPPYARRPALPCNVQCLTLLCIFPCQSRGSVAKKIHSTGGGYRDCRPRRIPVKEEGLMRVERCEWGDMIRVRYEPGGRTSGSRLPLPLHTGNERQRKRGSTWSTRGGRWYPTWETVWWWSGWEEEQKRKSGYPLFRSQCSIP